MQLPTSQVLWTCWLPLGPASQQPLGLASPNASTPHSTSETSLQHFAHCMMRLHSKGGQPCLAMAGALVLGCQSVVLGFSHSCKPFAPVGSAHRGNVMASRVHLPQPRLCNRRIKAGVFCKGLYNSTTKSPSRQWARSKLRAGSRVQSTTLQKCCGDCWEVSLASGDIK